MTLNSSINLKNKMIKMSENIQLCFNEHAISSLKSPSPLILLLPIIIWCTKTVETYFINLVHKKGNKRNVLNYTPISLTSGWVSEWHSDKMTQCVTLARRVTLAQRQNNTVCHFGTVRHFGTERHFNTATKWHGASL